MIESLCLNDRVYLIESIYVYLCLSMDVFGCLWVSECGSVGVPQPPKWSGLRRVRVVTSAYPGLTWPELRNEESVATQAKLCVLPELSRMLEGVTSLCAVCVVAFIRYLLSPPACCKVWILTASQHPWRGLTPHSCSHAPSCKVRTYYSLG